MTEIEQKALSLVNEVMKEMDLMKVKSLDTNLPGERALCRAIEQHQAFRQEVSDAINGCTLGDEAERRLSRFIIKPPEPPEGMVKLAREIVAGLLREAGKREFASDVLTGDFDDDYRMRSTIAALQHVEKVVRDAPQVGYDADAGGETVTRWPILKQIGSSAA